MKRIALLGSTGSIGKNCLDVVRRLKSQFQVVALTAKNNTELLAEQAMEFRPELCAVMDRDNADDLRNRLSGSEIDTCVGPEGLLEAATHPTADLVVNGLVASVGLMRTIKALEAGKDVALANKESLVMAGELIMNLAREKNVRIIPVDSEHSGIMQCLHGNRREDVARIILTASGGPFFNRRPEEFQSITPQQALEHPTWEMGPKITVDSATFMNKGLEVIEAHWLFDVPLSHIEVTVHKQSIVHSMVEFTDGSILAQIGIPDMRLPIQNALTFPDKMPSPYSRVDFGRITMLTFEKPDHTKFPCLKLAHKAGQDGGSTPVVLNAANEIAVQAFLENRISFERIPSLIEEAMIAHERIDRPSLDEIFAVDHWARNYVTEQLT